MKEQKGTDISQEIPVQHKGNSSDNSYEITAASSSEAERIYASSINRLLDINNWEKICGIGSAAFQLTDSDGNEVNRKVWESDLIRIDIPGPGPSLGEGYDWVAVERIDESEDHESNTAYVSITVRPSSNPATSDNNTAHFFSEEATSTFIVRKDNRRVIAEVHGRNELINSNTGKTVDNLRNTIVAKTATRAFSDIQWKSLVKALVNYPA